MATSGPVLKHATLLPPKGRVPRAETARANGARQARLAAAFLALLLPLGLADAAELHVVGAGGFAAAYETLAPQWEKQTGHTVLTEWEHRGEHQGGTPDALAQRLDRGERIDVVIAAVDRLDQLVAQGKVAGSDDVPLALSRIGVVVKQGGREPDVSTVAGLRQALLDAASIAYADGAGGAAIERELFRAMAIEDAVRGKARMIPGEPVGELVARGEAEIGLQPMSELKPIGGITLLGPVPQPLQLDTVIAAGVLDDSPEKDAARSLVAYLASPLAATAIKNGGMDPYGAPK